MARLLVLPRRELAAELASLRGRVLGIGSGHGLIERWLAELNPDVTVLGTELDDGRVAAARATQSRSPRVRLEVLDARAIAAVEEQFDAAVAVDLLHHLTPADLPELAAALARVVRSGGTLLIKDIADAPRWKERVNALHDRVVARQRTRGIAPAALAETFERAGFTIERVYRTRGPSPYPHFILRARRAPPAES